MVSIAQFASQWGNVPGSDLSALLSLLRAVYQIHQAAHWQSRGLTYYGDHLLFQRLYEAMVTEIDGVAERTVGTGGVALVDPISQAAQTHSMIEAIRGVGRRISRPRDLALVSLEAERGLLLALDETLRRKQSLGTQNLLQGIADTHEGHVYLLQQRVSAEP
jgi:DNA-binding ferritin-like protein